MVWFSIQVLPVHAGILARVLQELGNDGADGCWILDRLGCWSTMPAFRNGKDPAGLAQIDVNKDPTLRAGDVVATKDGMKVFRGSPSDTHKAADFSPLENARMPDSERRRLVSIKVTPRFDRPATAQP